MMNEQRHLSSPILQAETKICRACGQDFEEKDQRGIAGVTGLDEVSDTVTLHISFCEDRYVQTKTFCTYNNNMVYCKTQASPKGHTKGSVSWTVC